MKEIRPSLKEAFKRNNNFKLNIDSLDDSQAAAVTSEEDKILLRASAGSGKALKNGTKVLTNQGWKNIENLVIGEQVAGQDGKFHSVKGIYPQGLKQVYKIIFSDDNIIECSGDHLWTYQTKNQRDRHRNDWRYSNTNTTAEIYNQVRLKNNNGSWNVYIPMIEPLQYEEKDLPLDPYLLGVLLGDGSFMGKGTSFTCAEEDLLHKVQDILKQYRCELHYKGQYDYQLVGEKGYGYHNVQDYIGSVIRDLGLKNTDSHTKFIPQQYLFASEKDRVALLEGLIDTDGYCDASEYNICLASKQLILDIQFLCESLGFTAYYSEKHAYCNSKDCGIVYRLNIKTSEKYPKIHTTKNKDSRWKKGQTAARRTIREIIPTEEYAEMTCIEIDSPDHLFVTEHCIVTHNTKSLIAAIAAYRYEYMNDRICAITYTRAARAEMETRLQEMGVFDVEVTTIHVWSRNLLQDLAIKYDFKVRILEETDIKKILLELVHDYMRCRPVKVNINILYNFITGNKNMDITDGYRRTLTALETRYIQYKRDNALYDFMDYPLYLYNVLIAYNEEINNIDALFVDEFQDVDSTQFKIFEKVNAKKKFFVGDSWQSIFVFRGADGEVFEKAKDFTQYKLKHNYRSYQEIINYACTVHDELFNAAENGYNCYIAQVQESRSSLIVCDRGSGGVVSVVDPFGGMTRFGTQEKLDILSAFKDIISRQPMILCRTNKQVKFINDLGYFNASTIHQAKGLEYKSVIAIDSTINSVEDLNVAYVAMTRAENELFIINWQQFEQLAQVVLGGAKYGSRFI